MDACVDRNQIEAFVQACHKVAEHRLVRCSSGNLSHRLDGGLVLLSATRSWLGELTAAQVAICRIDTSQCLSKAMPTCESALHLGILRERTDQNVVLHFQSPFATAIACGRRADYDFNVIIEVPVYVGTPAFIEYLPPGSKELAEAAIRAMRDHDMVILRNHGLVTVGRDFDDAIQRAAFFELVCQILLVQDQPCPLPDSALPWLRQAGRA